MSETIYKLEPHRTLQLQGFDAFGAAAALWGASATGFSVSGVFRDQADFAVLQLWELDDYFGHPSFGYLPDSDFTGITLSFDIEWTGIQGFESIKFPWSDWPSLNCLTTDGVTHNVDLSTLATTSGARVGASTTITIVVGGSGAVAGDEVTLWYQNIGFDYTAGGGESAEAIASLLAGYITTQDWIANGPVVLSAQADGAVITITAAPGADGNMVAFYQINGTSTLLATSTNWQLSGGSSDSVLWSATANFSALGWFSIQKLWLTFAAALGNSAAYASTEFSVTVTNWTVTDASGHRPLSVAGPGSVRIEENSPWVATSGFWEAAPTDGFAFWSQGAAIRAADAGCTATVETHCQSVHNIYAGTWLDVNCGIVSASLDGGTPITLDCYAAVASKVRRLLFAGVAAGEHSVVLTITGTKNALSSGWYFYLDFLECAVLSAVPGPASTTAAVGVATDYDTNHTAYLSPERVLWNIQQLGQLGEVDHYAGVFYWNQRVRTNGVFPTAVATFGGAWASGDAAFLDIGGTTIRKSVFAADTASTIALHFANFINAVFIGVWASAAGAVLTITTRSVGANWTYSFTVSKNSGDGTIAVTGDLTTGGTEGNWMVDPTQTPVFNRAFRDWNTDWFAVLAAAGMGVVASFSQELVNPPDDPPSAVWIQRFPDGTPAITATGLGTLNSAQCAWGTAVQAYMAAAHLEMQGLMLAAGLQPKTQFGEVLWWYEADASGIAFYDADTTAAATTALGRALHTFLTVNDAPSVNAYADANFLRWRLQNFVDGIRATVLAAYSTALFELLWPMDVDDPSTAQLMRYVNLPPAWNARTGSGFDTFLAEGFQFGGVNHNVDQAQACAEFPFTAPLSWDAAHCRYLMGLYYSAWPWQREYVAAVSTGVPLVKLWAYDHVCLFGWPLPMPAAEEMSWAAAQ